MNTRWCPTPCLRFAELPEGRILQQAWVKEGLGYGLYGSREWQSTEEHVWRNVPLQSPENEDPRYWSREAPP